MGLDTKLIRNLNNSLKQLLAVMIVISIAIPQNLFANPSGDGSDNAPLGPQLSSIATSEKLAEIGIEPGTVHSLNSTGTFEGMKVDLDVVQAEFKNGDSEKLIRFFKLIEPQLKEAYANDPSTKIQFTYIVDASSKEISFEAREILNLLREVDQKTKRSDVKVKTDTVQKYRSARAKIFDETTKVFLKTTKLDLYLTAIRLILNGSSATYSFYLSDIPLPVSALVGFGVIGAGSASIGLLIEKYTTWLDNNKVDPSRRILNRLGSIETYMFLSPLLIGLQETGINTLEGAALIAGTATAATIVQNVYFQIKKRSENAAMWYKWYATEALFITAPSLVFPIWDVYTGGVLNAIGSTFWFALLSTASQGGVDVAVTKIRRPYLEAAIKEDIALLSQRLNGVNALSLSQRELYRLTHKSELAVRNKFKPFYFGASLISVASAIAGTAGRNMQRPELVVAAYIGMAILVVSAIGINYSGSFFEWYMNGWKKPAPAARRPYEHINLTCSKLFG